MRPATAFRQVEKSINQAVIFNDFDNLYSVSTKRALYSLLKKCKNEIPYGYRSGYESYGYQDKESNHYNLIYISDRFFCLNRLFWLWDGIENGEF